MGIQKPGLLEQLIINGGLSFVPIQLHADRGFDNTYGRQVRRRYSQVHRQQRAFRSHDAEGWKWAAMEVSITWKSMIICREQRENTGKFYATLYKILLYCSTMIKILLLTRRKEGVGQSWSTLQALGLSSCVYLKLEKIHDYSFVADWQGGNK